MLGTFLLIVIFLVLLIFVAALAFYLIFKNEVTQFIDELQGNSSVTERPEHKEKKKPHKDIEANHRNNKRNVHKVDHKKVTPIQKVVVTPTRAEYKHKESKDQNKTDPQIKTYEKKAKNKVKTKENKSKDKKEGGKRKHRDKSDENETHRDKSKEKENPVKKVSTKKAPPPPPKIPVKEPSGKTIAMGTQFGEADNSESDKVVKKVGTEEFIPGQGHLQSTIPKPVSKIE